MMGETNMGSNRLNQIPVLYVRGDNFTVGQAIGRQFRALIEDSLANNAYFQNNLLPAYETPEGKCLYQKQLEKCNKKFPEYVQELQGMAVGSLVPFYKLFLLNLDVFLTSLTDWLYEKQKGLQGCTSILSNGKELILGHTEDAAAELLNNVFIVSAEVLNQAGEKVEKFTTLTYAGCLPGYTMGYNENGFIYSVNTLYPLVTISDGTPRTFIARRLLRAKHYEEVVEVMKDNGAGISDGFGVNACFAKVLEGPPLMYNIECCPNPGGHASQMNILEIKPGETYAHCNKVLRIEIEQLKNASSVHRHCTIETYPKPETFNIIREIISDNSDPVYPIFRQIEKSTVTTVAAGIFDIGNRLWNIYIEPPNKSSPVAVLPLIFKE